MKKLFVMLLAVTLTAIAASADEASRYRAFADTLRTEVFSTELPAFRVKEIPQKYSKESAVIKAIYQSVEARKRTGVGVGVGILGLPSVTRRARVEFGRLTRMLLHINDKAALDKYSEFDFDLNSKKSFYRGYEKKRFVMGVRLIKPDGSIVDVDTSDFVEVNEGKDGKQKSRKLAIPGLEIGDDIDVFFYAETKLQNAHPDPITFSLKDEEPILNYQIHCVIDDNLTTQYRCMNGAPDFKVSRDEDKNYVLDLELNDITSHEPRLWYSSGRQSPYIRMYVFNRRNKEAFTPLSARKDGLQGNPDVNTIIEDRWTEDDWWAKKVPNYAYSGNIGGFKGSRKFYGALKQKVKDGTLSQRQAADYLYNYLAYGGFGKRNLMRDGYFARLFCFFLDYLGISTEVGIVADSGTEPLDKMLNLDECTYIVRLADDTTRYYISPQLDMPILAPGEIGRQFQGRPAAMWRPKKERREVPAPMFTLPMGDLASNRNVATLDVTLDGSVLDVRRTERFSGATKPYAWRVVALADVDEGYNAWLNRYGFSPVLDENKKELADRLAHNEDERKTQIDDFKEEAKSYHDAAPSEFVSARVLDLGIDPEQPILSYELEYKLDNCVKRAGRNIVVDLGRLLNSQTTILPSDRERDVDAWMGLPREYATEINLDIPDGYRVDARSLKALGCSVENACGQFVATAREADGKLIAEVRIQYRKPFVSVAEWPGMLKVVEAAVRWNSTTVVLEKR